MTSPPRPCKIQAFWPRGRGLMIVLQKSGAQRESASRSGGCCWARGEDFATEMPTEGEPGGLIRATQLFTLSTAWGMQAWVTFIAGFVLFRSVNRHTFGLVQSKLFPFYFYTLLGCTFLNLAIFAAYHPRELLTAMETIQIGLFFLSLVLTAVNASWFSPATTQTMLKMQEVEREHGLGKEVGHSAQREAYQLLKEKDAKYRHLRQKFFTYHGLTSLLNLACVICTGVNLACLALHLDSL